MAKNRTFEEHTKLLRKKIREITKENKPLYLGASTGVSMLVERVFEDGLDSNLRQIGKYDKKPIYVNPDDSPKKFKPMGKTGETKFKNGKPHKTRYFKSGYKGFRRHINREFQVVNLRLTNDLQSDVSNNLVPPNSRRVAKKGATPVKLSKDSYAIWVNPTNAEKVEGLEDHFGKRIFGHTQIELEEIVRVVEFELAKRLRL